MKKLKMYVWDEVLCDYSCGIGVALAYTKKQARELLIKELGHDSDSVRTILEQEPEIFDKPGCTYAYGGG